MSDTTTMGSRPEAQDVQAYITAVRAWLADLPADEVEDLTAGMEADLAERVAESGGRLGDLLGQPEAYAAELRSAAGLPPRVDSPVTRASSPPWTERLAREAHDLVGRHPWLRELRPTWWLARGAVAGWVVAAVTGAGRTVLLPLLGAALSMWLGTVLRRREPLGTGTRVALGGGNALAVVLLLPMLAFATSGSSDDSGYSDGAAPTPDSSSQVVANGEPVQNLYAYDAAGHRVDGVRVYDQTGRALVVDLSPLMDGSIPDLPTRPEDGEPDVANDVFPLAWPGHDGWGDTGFGWTPPLTLPPLAGAVPGPTPATTPSATPSESPSPSPTSSP